MDKVTTTRKLDGSEAVIKMTVLGEGGQAREREISMATKLYDGGKTEKRIYRFLSPADVQGTGILVYDYEAKPDDVWIYLPALRKTRRVVSTQRAQSFMGSEFSYGDLNIPSLDDFNYTLVKEEPMAGEPYYVIDLVPKTKEIAEAEGYSKKTYWVSKAKMAVLRGLYYDKDGKLLEGAHRPGHQAARPEEQAVPGDAHGDDQQAERAQVGLRDEEGHLHAHHQGRLLHHRVSRAQLTASSLCIGSASLADAR